MDYFFHLLKDGIILLFECFFVQTEVLVIHQKVFILLFGFLHHILAKLVNFLRELLDFFILTFGW